MRAQLRGRWLRPLRYRPGGCGPPMPCCRIFPPTLDPRPVGVRFEGRQPLHHSRRRPAGHWYLRRGAFRNMAGSEDRARKGRPPARSRNRLVKGTAVSRQKGPHLNSARAREALVVGRLEAHLSKDEILHPLSQQPSTWEAAAYGMWRKARLYFDKRSGWELRMEEAAIVGRA